MHLLPGSDLAADTWWAMWHMDKLLHGFAFLGCGLTWAIALAKQRRLQGGSRMLVVLVGTAFISARSLKPFRVRGCLVEPLTLPMSQRMPSEPCAPWESSMASLANDRAESQAID